MATESISETKYLQNQARKAKATIGASLHDIKVDVINHADPRRLVRKHPWLTLSAVAVLGFLVVTRIGRGDDSEPEAPEPAKKNQAPPERDTMRKVRKWVSRAKLIINVVKPLVEGFLAMQTAAAAEQEASKPGASSANSHAE